MRAAVVVLAGAAALGVFVARHGRVQWWTPAGRLALPAVLPAERELARLADELLRAAA